MKISKRLKTVLNLIPNNCEMVFDVGADHGYLTWAIIENKLSKKVVASDISAPSLQKTIDLVKEKGIGDFVSTIVSDGLNDYPKELTADVVVIAGMGGNEILKILKNIKNIKNYKSFIVQPMQDADVLRQGLNALNFEIMSDIIIEENGKFYSIIKVRKVNKKLRCLTTAECLFGVNYLINRDEEFLNFVNLQKNKFESRKDYLTEKDLINLSICYKILDENNKGE
jgi:tRNA (adenine22-N1)-methyltransferase